MRERQEKAFKEKQLPKNLFPPFPFASLPHLLSSPVYASISFLTIASFAFTHTHTCIWKQTLSHTLAMSSNVCRLLIAHSRASDRGSIKKHGNSHKAPAPQEMVCWKNASAIIFTSQPIFIKDVNDGVDGGSERAGARRSCKSGSKPGEA